MARLYNKLLSIQKIIDNPKQMNQPQNEEEEEEEEEKVEEMTTNVNGSVFNHVNSFASTTLSSSRTFYEYESTNQSVSPPTQQELFPFCEGEKRQKTIHNITEEEEEEEEDLRGSLESISISPPSSSSSFTQEDWDNFDRLGDYEGSSPISPNSFESCLRLIRKEQKKIRSPSDYFLENEEEWDY